MALTEHYRNGMSISIKYNLDVKKLIELDSFNKISNYDKVVWLECCCNQLTSLPNLSNSLQELWCSYNKLTVLPKLPNSLQLIGCGFNKLSELPELPNSLKELNCMHNQLTSLPELPNSLQLIRCEDNKFIKTRKHKYLIKIIYI
jgi:Leucine-rich repeat (LRR) protein